MDFLNDKLLACFLIGAAIGGVIGFVLIAYVLPWFVWYVLYA